VSPLIGGRAVKGPAAAMLERLAGGATPAHVASCYTGLIDVLVLDPADEQDAAGVEALGIRPVVVPTLMDGEEAGRRLAEAVYDAAVSLA
jgi:LPPG:FO 2-phospho-L-lactate transferase